MTKKDTIKYRSCWMAISILWVIFEHSQFGMPNAFFAFVKHFRGSVDAFVFASGMGCYYSLQRDENVLHFAERRFHKLAPAYFLVIIPFMFYQCLVLKVPFSMVWGNLFFTQPLTSGTVFFNWYIAGIWIYYLLAPYFCKLVDRLNIGRNFIVLAILLLFSYTFRGTYTLIIIAVRIPVFYLGMMFGKLREDYRFSAGNIILIELLMLAGIAADYLLKDLEPEYLWSTGLYWYPSLLIVCGYCSTISAACRFLERFLFGQRIVRMLSAVGSVTFELFLVHIFIYDILVDLFADHPNQRLVWIVGTLTIIPVTLLLKQTVTMIDRRRSSRHEPLAN